jgi:hypothetical protein
MTYFVGVNDISSNNKMIVSRILKLLAMSSQFLIVKLLKEERWFVTSIALYYYPERPRHSISRKMTEIKSHIYFHQSSVGSDCVGRNIN